MKVLSLGTIGASIAAALGAAAAVSCSSPQPVACGGCGCGDATPPTQTFDVSFEFCADAGAADAGDADAQGDAATTCFANCGDACNASRPGAVCLGTADDGGATIAHCSIQAMCTGRKLDGLAPPDVRGAGFGAALAEMAWLEAASVRAFERLARELRFHGAPASLVKRAERCARDEARHARAMARVARKHGASVPRVRVERGVMRVRDLESLARENAVEGCVGETFGAAQAALRAKTTADPDLTRALAAIAPDELRHAALGWAVAAWAEARLSSEGRARVRRARNAAARELLQTTRTSPSEHALAARLFRDLWAA